MTRKVELDAFTALLDDNAPVSLKIVRAELDDVGSCMQLLPNRGLHYLLTRVVWFFGRAQPSTYSTTSVDGAMNWTSQRVVANRIRYA